VLEYVVPLDICLHIFTCLHHLHLGKKRITRKT